jgi:hypothetical protein
MNATQVANGGRIHPEKCLICLEAQSRANEPTRDRRLYRKEEGNRQGEIFRRSGSFVYPKLFGSSSSAVRTNYFVGAVGSRHHE